ncbi:hypothetical protein GGI42DRAFT_6192 [Trichoderma sp. SZMC 28013]
MTDLALPPTPRCPFLSLLLVVNLLYLYLFELGVQGLPSLQPGRGGSFGGVRYEAERHPSIHIHIHIHICNAPCVRAGACPMSCGTQYLPTGSRTGVLGGNCEQTNRTGGGVGRGVYLLEGTRYSCCLY